MVSSFLQYLTVAPSFTNVLNVYAFCNLHDVSWGTKGSDKVDVLPSVSSKSKDTEAGVVEDHTRVQEDVDSAFKETVTRALAKIVKKEEIEKPTMDDQNKTFRTRLVALWMITNAALAIAIADNNAPRNEDDPEADLLHLQKKQNIYFSIILYTTFVLALIRFLGVSVCLSSSTFFILTLLSSAYSTSSNATSSVASAVIKRHNISHRFIGASFELRVDGPNLSFHLSRHGLSVSAFCLHPPFCLLY